MIKKLSVLFSLIILLAISACASNNSMLGTGGEADEITKLGTPVENEPVPESLKDIIEGYLTEKTKWEGGSKTDTIYLEFDVPNWEIYIFSRSNPKTITVGFEIGEDGNITTADNAYTLDLSLSEEKLKISDAAGSIDAELVNVVQFSCNECHVVKAVNASGFDTKEPQYKEVNQLDSTDTLNDIGRLGINRLLF